MTKSYPDLENNVRCLVSQASPAIGLFSAEFAASNIYAWGTGRASETNHIEDFGDTLERRLSVNTNFQTFENFTWDEGDLTLTGTGASFASYTWKHLDRVRIIGGTGADVGSYLIASKTNDNVIVLASSIGAAADTETDISGNVVTGTQFVDAYLDYQSLLTGALEWDLSGTITGTTNLADADYAYTETAHVVTEAGAFAAYTWAAGDRMYVESGTGAIPGWYLISRRVSDDAIELVDSIGAGANGQTFSGRIHKANSISFKLYCANEDGSSPTNLLVNPTTLTFPYVLEGTSTVTNWRCRIRLVPIAPHSISTDTSAYLVTAEWTQAYTTSTSVGHQQEVRYGALARGTVNLKRPLRFYVTYAKAVTGNTFELLPRNVMVTQYAPFLGG